MTALRLWVYIYRDAAGAPIYVGSTGNRAQRDRSHQNGSRWYDAVRAVEYEGPHNRLDGLRREIELISTLQPCANRAHTPGYRAVDQKAARQAQVSSALGAPIGQWVRARRDEGSSWFDIRCQLGDRIGQDLSPSPATLANWADPELVTVT